MFSSYQRGRPSAGAPRLNTPNRQKRLEPNANARHRLVYEMIKVCSPVLSESRNTNQNIPRSTTRGDAVNEENQQAAYLPQETHALKESPSATLPRKPYYYKGAWSARHKNHRREATRKADITKELQHSNYIRRVGKGTTRPWRTNDRRHERSTQNTIQQTECHGLPTSSKNRTQKTKSF